MAQLREILNQACMGHLMRERLLSLNLIQKPAANIDLTPINATADLCLGRRVGADLAVGRHEYGHIRRQPPGDAEVEFIVDINVVRESLIFLC
jgi:hypothetical protein